MLVVVDGKEGGGLGFEKRCLACGAVLVMGGRALYQALKAACVREGQGEGMRGEKRRGVSIYVCAVDV